MEISQAREIVEALADGINPVTGEVLPAEDSCNQPDVIRALNAVLKQIEAKPKKGPKNAGAKWSAEEEQLLVKMYKNGATKKEMRGTFSRTENALAARLVHLGIIKDRDVFRSRK